MQCHRPVYPHLAIRPAPRGDRTAHVLNGRISAYSLCSKDTISFPATGVNGAALKKKARSTASRSSNSSSSEPTGGGASEKGKTPFGYTRKDVLLIGVGVTVFGFGLKSGLEFVGVDPLAAGNAVQLIVVLGLMVGWISTYMFRVSNKEMTYAQQLRDYEVKVMEKRLEGLTEAELAALLEQVEEEKSRQAAGEQVN